MTVFILCWHLFYESFIWLTPWNIRLTLNSFNTSKYSFHSTYLFSIMQLQNFFVFSYMHDCLAVFLCLIFLREIVHLLCNPFILVSPTHKLPGYKPSNVQSLASGSVPSLPFYRILAMQAITGCSIFKKYARQSYRIPLCQALGKLRGGFKIEEKNSMRENALTSNI